MKNRAGTAIASLAALALSQPCSGQTTAAVACGSPVDLVLSDGSVYGADQIYTGNNGYGAIGGFTGEGLFDVLEDGRPQDELALYQEQRAGASGYVLEVPNGVYELTIHIATYLRDGIGIAPLSLVAESDTVVAAYDYIAESSKGRPVDIRALVTVGDGACDIDLASQGGDHDIAAIGLRPADLFDSSAPAAPDSVVALDTYGGVLLRWTRAGETDLVGYRVLQRVAGGWRTIHDTRRIATCVVPTDTTTHYAIVAFDLYGNESDTTFSLPAGPRDRFDSLLPRYEIFLDPLDLTLLDEDPTADVDVPGLLVADGILIDPVTLSYRGKSSRWYPKKSWSIDLDGFILHGSDDLIIRSNWDDPTIQRELLSVDLMERTDLAHTRAFPIRLEHNGEYRGVHIEMERVDEAFVARQGWSPAGRLYRVDASLERLDGIEEYRALYSPKLADDWDRADILELVEGLERIPDADILPWLEERVDMEQFLGVVCHQIVSANRDWASDDYYLYREGPSSPWKWVAWDVGESWSAMSLSLPIVFGTEAYPEWDGEWNRLWNRVVGIPPLMRRYTETLRSYLNQHLAADTIAAVLDARVAEMRADALRDVHKRGLEFVGPYEAELANIETFIDGRRTEIDLQLPLVEPPEHVLIQISELIPGAQDTVVALEVRNLASRPFAFVDFAISDDPGDPLRWSLPADTILAHGLAYFTLPSPIAAGSWVGLGRDVGAPQGTIVDSVTLPAQLSGIRSYGRYPDNSLRWRQLDGRTPGTTNQWTQPIQLELELSDQVVAEGDPIEVTIELTNAGPDLVRGDVVLELRTWDGIHHLDSALYARQLVLPPGRIISRALNTFVPSGLGDPYGYRLDLRFLVNGDDEWASISREVFLEGPPVGFPVINELVAINDTTLADEAGEYDDWVEILNPTSQQMVLDGLYLTDDFSGAPQRWAIPTTTLAPGATLIIWCDNDLAQGTYHASFKLGGGGEEVALVFGASYLIDRWVFGPQTADISIGRYPDGQATWVTLDAPSPGAPNVYSPR